MKCFPNAKAQVMAAFETMASYAAFKIVGAELDIQTLKNQVHSPQVLGSLSEDFNDISMEFSQHIREALAQASTYLDLQHLKGAC